MKLYYTTEIYFVILFVIFCIFSSQLESDLHAFIHHMCSMNQKLVILAIPLYHLLSGQFKPGEPLKYSDQHDTAAWWGTLKIKKAIYILNYRITVRYVYQLKSLKKKGFFSV